MNNSSLLEKLHQLPNKIIATVHKEPDYDAIGSLLALGELIEQLGKNVTLFAPDIDLGQFEHLPGIEQLSTTIESEYDLAIYLDCSNQHRIFQPNKFPTYKESINIDHHQDNTHFATYNLVQSISSVGEIMFNLFQTMNIPLNKKIATQIYAAICFDTGNFKFSNTTTETFKVAAELLSFGIPNHQISEWIFENKEQNYFEDIKTGLNNMYIDPKHPFTLVFIPHNNIENRESTINFFRTLKGKELTVVCKETSEKTFKLSFRSKNKIDVSRLAKIFNGGGHKRAAGAYCSKITLPELKNKLIKKIYEVFE
ncbi:MAG: bifunctional oligoribonuclease/PAP phosphatase NrnA [Candidatus Margulisiibacteriota bacterium]